MTDTEKSFPFDSIETEDGTPDRLFYSADFADYFKQFISNGVYPNPSTNLQVQSLNNNMVLTVLSGSAFINGYGYINKEAMNITISNAHQSYNRIDIIVVQLSLIDREIKIVYKEGIANPNPQKPELVRNSDIHELQLAEITIKTNATKISTADIKDTRLDNLLCGIVSAVVKSVDTETLFIQYQDYLNSKIEEWNLTQAEQEQQFNQQMMDIDEKEEEIQNWYDITKATIFDTKYFDFDNFIYRKGFSYEVIKETNPNLRFTETIKNTSDSSVYSTRISEKLDNNTWVINTICSSLEINNTITYTKQSDGNWKGVIT